MQAINKAEELAQAQLEAYNKKDLDAFCLCYAFPIEIFNFPDPDPTVLSEDEFRQRYGDYFTKEPKAHCEILQRTSLKNYVVDRELITGLSQGTVLECIAIYDVIDGLIRRIWFIK